MTTAADTAEFFCTLGKHAAPTSEMRTPPPSAPARRQCRACASARQRARYVKADPFDWAERFLERVVESENSCWLWQGAHANGYGVTTVLGELMLAHRVSYLLHTGDLPAGAFICHHCDSRGCCNPSHLYAGDVQSNSNDAVARGRLRPPTGEQQGQAKLTAPKVREIRSAHSRGTNLTTLADTYGVSPSAISKVVRRITWKHVN